MLALHPQEPGGSPDAWWQSCSQQGSSPSPGLSGRTRGQQLLLRDWFYHEQNSDQEFYIWLWEIGMYIFLVAPQVPLDSKKIKPVYPKGTLSIHWKDGCWSRSCSTLATWWEDLTHWKRPWCWESLKSKVEEEAQDERVELHHWFNGREF